MIDLTRKELMWIYDICANAVTSSPPGSPESELTRHLYKKVRNALCDENGNAQSVSMPSEKEKIKRFLEREHRRIEELK